MSYCRACAMMPYSGGIIAQRMRSEELTNQTPIFKAKLRPLEGGHNISKLLSFRE